MNTAYTRRQAETERNLIEAIKARGLQVVSGEFGGCIRVIKTTANSVSSRSIWLGRAGTIARLQEVLAS